MTTERILLADDHPLTRDALGTLLRQNGFDVVGEAGGGEEAIELARELRPDLVLLDLSMPTWTGSRRCRSSALRRRRRRWSC